MKKSVVVACYMAKETSIKHPDITVRVMDKRGRSAVVCTSEWVRRERIMAGWHQVAAYRAGREVNG